VDGNAEAPRPSGGLFSKLRQRVGSGVLLGGAFIAAAFFLPAYSFLAVFLALGAIALLEFYALLDARQIPHFKVVGTVSGLVLIAGTWLAYTFRFPGWQEAETVLLGAASAAIFVRQIAHRSTNRPWETVAGTLLGVIYVAFLLGFVSKLLTAWGDAVGRLLVLYLVAVVKFTDIGAYFVGCAIGRHKMIPRISPAKTWEGTVGGEVTAIGVSLAFAHFAAGRLEVFHLDPWRAAGLGFVLAVAGILGDLVESVFKRAAGVKDSGTIIQGMGGLLDVLDSLLFAAPVMYVACLWLAHL
jgi:phosphatidate cytidylyltransferase